VSVGLPQAALDWASSHLGSPIESASVLTGGVASQMHLLRTSSGQEAVLRRLTFEPWRRFADGLLRREYDVQGMLQASEVPAPAPIAVDPDGSEVGDPALLMSRLPGRVDLVRADRDYLSELAVVLVRLHRFRPPANRWPREYQSWAFESKRLVPPWSSDDALYLEAFKRLGEEPPAYRPTFLHRDYYPANVLWEDGVLSGVVDWVETSTGPADLDVAHCASNLAGLHGAEVARAFRQAYVDAGGMLEEDEDASRYWQLLDLVGFLPGDSGRESGAAPATITEVWRANGRSDLTVELARRGREDLLRAVLG
jgi:aminoglycoside phosphotransferase (APT) family kinase protein